MDHTAYLQARLLKAFRANCKISKSKTGRLNQLKEFADYCFRAEEDTWPKRLEFMTISDSLYVIGAKDDCFACDGMAEVRHHVFQLQNGGINDIANIVFICNPCHEEIHPWMKNPRAAHHLTLVNQYA